MTPYYVDDFVTLYHGDCREAAPVLGLGYAVVTDPPYGMNWNTDSTRFTMGERKRGDGRKDWGDVRGDAEPFDPEPWLQYPAVVLWGSNHYANRLPVGTTLVWLKKDDHLFGSFLSDCEIAWRKGGHGSYAFRKQFPPPSRMAEAFGKTVHPTQKPLALMRWSIERCGNADLPILDPFAGSGTTLRAAKDLGRKAVGVEIEERYCDVAARRCAQEVIAA
jgi:site-specific DNA-methyltransferase (adenine-specific)